MAIRYKNPQTGEYEVIKIPVVKGEQGHAGIHVGTDAPPTTDVKLWFDPSDTDNDVDLANRLDTTLTACYDYMGNDRGSIKEAADANVEYILGEVNTVHYEGQHITATDTIEKQVRSAILKGQTLVNLCPNKVIDYIATSDWDGFNGLGQNSNTQGYSWKTLHNLKPNTKYFISCHVERFDVAEGQYYLLNNSNNSTVFEEPLRINTTGTHKWVLTSKSEFTEGVFIVLRCQNAYARGAIKIRDIMLIEYQDGMENWDLKYFEGMKSVRMPVLTTTGKNLFNGILTVGSLNTNGSFNNAITDRIVTDYIKLGNGTFTESNADGLSMARRCIYDKDKNFIREYSSSKTFTLSNNEVYIRTCYLNTANINAKIQVEQGSQATAYEPHKTNILTVNEEVELRGIGDIRDEVNLLTGEKVERLKQVKINEVVSVKELDGYIQCRYNTTDRKNISNGMCNKFNYRSWTATPNHWDVFVGGAGEMYFVVPMNLFEANVASANEWFVTNDVFVCYPLEQESIKTVDLSGQKVYSYDGTTHYNCSAAEGALVPTLSIDVPTNLPALVTKQRQQIETLKEENQALTQDLQLAIASSETNDYELLAQSFELDFRLMEVEFALDLPMAATFRLGGKTMAMTPYNMAKKLILAGSYERADMEHKLSVYVSKKRMTEAQRQELIQLMDEKEGIVTIEPIEPEAPKTEEIEAEHEAVVIPLH